MENKLIVVLVVGLIAAIVFHALTVRFEIVAAGGGQGTVLAYRIDRLTGDVSLCTPDGLMVRCLRQ
jgi:hypothetical protein